MLLVADCGKHFQQQESVYHFTSYSWNSTSVLLAFHHDTSSLSNIICVDVGTCVGWLHCKPWVNRQLRVSRGSSAFISGAFSASMFWPGHTVPKTP